MHKPSLYVAALVALAVGPSCDCSKNVTVEGNHGSIRIDSNELDFGPVTEFTDAGRPIVVRNVGRAPLTLTSVSIESDGGTEFTVASYPSTIAVSGQGDIAIDFSPLGSGEDFAVAVIRSDDPDQPEIRVSIHGGPIYPGLEFDPDGGFLTFVPTSMALTQKPVLLRSVGGSTLTVTSVGVAATGNPDFSVVPPSLPALLRPGQSVPVIVEYSRSSRSTEGLMSVNSDDVDAGRRVLRLIPDPAAACSDQVDNDADGLSDFPDDPGCSSPADTDEFNDPQCVAGAMRACGSSVGACRPGAQTCMLGAWYPCDGGTKMMGETCNGLDDDCDGVTDEEITDICTLNGCMGARACIPDSGVGGGQFGTCIPINATTETCNGLDDDCDGTTDEGIVQTCMLNGCLGQRICIPGGDGGFTSCSVQNPPTETCNGIDDDCDGTVDDVQPALQSCGFGVCARTIPACVDGGMPVCMPGMGSMEICNGIDDDCDGTADDGLGSNSCGIGACFRSVPACLADGGMNSCVPGMQAAEMCNNADDDCDMVTDEGPDGGPITQACFSVPAAQRNVGRCRDGLQACSSGSFPAGCPGEVTPIAEQCNNTDDDCDMVTDEGPDGGPVSQACFTVPAAQRNVGRCRDGTQLCTSGSFPPGCPGEVTPVAETCNNVDDNCSGSVDESLTRSCYTGPAGTSGVGTCRGGTQTCSAGSWGATCPGEVVPVVENCSLGTDENCNGQINEGCDAGNCNPNGTFFRDGGAFTYSCCEFFGSPLVVININRFVISGTGTSIQPLPSQPGSTLIGNTASCPSGPVAGRRQLGTTPSSTECVEVYWLDGGFVSANEWRGVYTATFIGGGCTSGLCGTPCFNQSWPVQAFR